MRLLFTVSNLPVSSLTIFLTNVLVFIRLEVVLIDWTISLMACVAGDVAGDDELFFNTPSLMNLSNKSEDENTLLLLRSSIAVVVVLVAAALPLLLLREAYCNTVGLVRL